MIKRFSKPLIDAGDGLVVNADICGQSIRRLELVESGDDGDFATQLPQAFLTLAPIALHIAAARSADPEGTAKYALSAT